MKSIHFFLKYFEEIIAGTFMVLMSLATFGNVVARYAFDSPIQWAEEFSRYAFIWMVFMGAAACSKRKMHIVIDAVVSIVPKPWRAIFSLLTDVAILVLMMVIVYYGSILCRLATQATSTLKIPQYSVYLVVPISAALIFIHLLAVLQDDLRDLLKGGERP